jgi:hypothetical protein
MSKVENSSKTVERLQLMVEKLQVMVDKYPKTVDNSQIVNSRQHVNFLSR